MSSVGQPKFFSKFEIPINDRQSATTYLMDYSHIITILPEEMGIRDILGYMEVHRRRIEELIQSNKVSRLRRFYDRLRYFLMLLTQKKRRLSSLYESWDSVKIVTQTPSEVIAVTEIEFDGDILLRVPRGWWGRWRGDLIKVHGVNVDYALSVWRDDVGTLIDVLLFARKAWLVMAAATILSSIGTFSITGFVINLTSLRYLIPLVMSLVTAGLYYVKR